LRRQPGDRHADDDRVVARHHQVDQHDLQQGAELAGAEVKTQKLHPTPRFSRYGPESDQIKAAPSGLRPVLAQLGERQAERDHADRADRAADHLGMRQVRVEPGGDRAGIDDLDDLAVDHRVVLAVAGHHFAGNPADQRRADHAEPGEAVEQLGDQGGADDDDGDRDDETDHDQREVALGGGGDGNRIVEAHHGIGHDDGPDRGPDVGVRLDVGPLLLLDDELDADPQQQRAAHQLEVGHAQQHADHGAEHDAQDDGAGAAEDDGRTLVLVRQVVAGHGDDHGVVAR